MLSITPFTHLLSFLFENPSGAQRQTAILYIILNIVLLIVSWLLSLIKIVKDKIKLIVSIYLMPEAVYGIALRDVLYPDIEHRIRVRLNPTK